jgi:hypothetical protein
VATAQHPDEVSALTTSPARCAVSEKYLEKEDPERQVTEVVWLHFVLTAPTHWRRHRSSTVLQ